MFEWIIGIYLTVAILLSASMVLLNRNSLKKLTSWQMIALFAFSPVVALRVLFYQKKGK